jgi:endonuclease G
VVCLLLATALALGLIIVYQGRRMPAITLSQRPVQPVPLVLPPVRSAARVFAGTHCYAGEPLTAPAFRDAILVITNTGYVTGYCETRKDPAWVCFRLFKVDNLQAPPRPGKFEADPRVSRGAVSADYTGSGYDRGHMAPNYAIAVCYGQRAQLETFLMSNIIPQKPKLNRGIWENLESMEIRIFAQKFKVIWVVDGPVFGSSVKLLKSGVAVPDACYRIIAREDEGTPRIMAFIMPQDVAGNESLERFMTSVREIERATGLDFFSELPDDLENSLETQKTAAMW